MPLLYTFGQGKYKSDQNIQLFESSMLTASSVDTGILQPTAKSIPAALSDVSVQGYYAHAVQFFSHTVTADTQFLVSLKWQTVLIAEIVADALHGVNRGDTVEFYVQIAPDSSTPHLFHVTVSMLVNFTSNNPLSFTQKTDVTLSADNADAARRVIELSLGKPTSLTSTGATAILGPTNVEYGVSDYAIIIE